MNKNGRSQRGAIEASNWRLHRELDALFGPRTRRAEASVPRTLSHYELRKEIGTGARGTVYLARDRLLDRYVAIKVLRSGLRLEPASRARFLREARCASALNHPNVITVHELGRDQEIDFVVMEHVAGKTLDQMIPRNGLPLECGLDYARQITQAVAAVHSAGMAHRDLKPSNFVLSKTGTIKLLDFGLAKVVGLSPRLPSGDNHRRALQTREGTILGTVGYMSPEQVRGEPADRRSDIFSLGAILYEMLTGHRAFHEDTPIDTMGAILHQAPFKMPARIPTLIIRIVRRCLEKKPSRRFISAKELAIALGRAAEMDNR